MMSRNWWNRRWVAATAVLAMAMPLLWPTIPPLLDLPSHMASYHVSVNLERSPDLQRYFDFRWQLIGNLGVDTAVVPLARVLRIEAATKLVVLLIPTLTALGLLLAARQTHGRLPPTAFAALPLAYNYPFMYGFVNYCLSAALAILAWVLWLRWPSERNSIWRAAAFAVIAAAVWLTHAIGWVMLGAMCGAYELYRQNNLKRGWAQALAATVAAGLPLAAPVLLIIVGPHEGDPHVEGWLDWFFLAKWSLTPLRDRWMAFDLASMAFIGALIGAGMIRLGGLRLLPAIAWPALALLVLYIVAPDAINDSAFVNTRLGPYAAALAVLAIDTRRLAVSRQALLAAGAAAFLAIRLVANTASFFLYDAAYRRELGALDHVPRGGAVLTFSRVPCQSSWANWYNPRLYHLAGLATVRRDAFVNATWGIAGLHLLRVRYTQAGAFQGDPSEMVSEVPCRYVTDRTLTEAIATAPLSAFDRVWLIGIKLEQWPHDARLQPIWHSDLSVLYRVKGARR